MALASETGGCPGMAQWKEDSPGGQATWSPSLITEELCEFEDVTTSYLSKKGAELMTENVICSTESA